MKNLILIILVIFTYSCKTCYECSVSWTKETWKRYSTGIERQVAIQSDGYDSFEECDKDVVKTKEQQGILELHNIDWENYYYRIGKCKCVKQ